MLTTRSALTGLGLTAAAIGIAAACVSTAAADRTWPVPGMVTAGSGHWGRTAWILGVSQGKPGYVCYELSLDGEMVPRQEACDPVSDSTTSQDAPDGLEAPINTENGPPFSPVPWVFGVLVAAARTVDVTYSNGHSVEAAALPAPRSESRKIALFVAPLQCGTYPKSVQIYGAGRKLIGQWPPPTPGGLPPFPGRPATC